MNVDYGFTLLEVTSLRYFIPLFRELEKQKKNFVIFCDKASSKLTSLKSKENVQYLKDWQDRVVWYQNTNELYNKIEEVNLKFIFTVEGTPFKEREAGRKWKIIVIPSLTDYIEIFKIFGINGDIFMSLGPMTDKYLQYPSYMKVVHLGNPKYDFLARCKVDTNFKRPILLFAPNQKDIIRSLWPLILIRIWGILKNEEIILKTRAKHNSFLLKIIFNKIFIDESFENSTSLEMVCHCRFAITFDSTAFKECLVVGRPIVNFYIKNYRYKRSVLHDFFSQCSDHKMIFDLKNKFFSPWALFKIFNSLLVYDYSQEVKALGEKWIYFKEKSSEKIINFIENEQT